MAVQSGPARHTVTVVACAYAVVMAGTTLPTALYPALQQAYGYATATSTQLFAVYAAVVVIGLVIAGSASDRFGRRRILWVAIAAAVASGIAYATAGTAAALFVGRALSGVSAALATGTATAFLVDAARTARAGAAVATGANMIGLGIGPVLGAGVAALNPARTTTAPFVAHAVLATFAAGALLLADPGHARSARGIIMLPAVPRALGGRFLLASACSLGFVVMGACTAMSAIVLDDVLTAPPILLLGLAGSAIFLATAIGQLMGTRVSRWRRSGFLLAGAGLIAIGMSGLGAPTSGGAAAVLYVAGVVTAGLSHGILFPHAVQRLLEHAPPGLRARVSTAYWCVAYGATITGAVAIGAASTWVGERLGITVFAGIALISYAAAAIACARREPGTDTGAGRPESAIDRT